MSRHRRLGCFAAVAALAAGGCGSEGAAPSSAYTVRDSAGIRIVESGGTNRSPAPFTLATAADWQVGELEGTEATLLSRVVGALEGAGGEVVVGNGDTNELRFFDRDGRWIRTLGGTGEGPGEFEYLRALGPCYPDGFVAFDLNWQQNRYRTDGTFIDKTVLRAPSGLTPYALACDDAGNFLILGWGRAVGAGPILGFHRTHDRLVLVDDAGGVRADFGDRLVSERIGMATGSRPHPAGRATRFAIHDGRAYVGSGEGFEVEVWGLDGTLEALIRGPTLPLAVTDSLKRAYLESQLEGVEDASRRASLRSAIEEWEWPDRVPAFTELKVDPTGVVWLEQFALTADAPEVWSLLHPERAYLGDLRLAPGQTLLSIEEDHVLVLTRDELGVERVARLALDRG